MPTVCEIKAELKELGVKGITGKKKAELMAMLEHAKAPKPKGIPTPRRKRPAIIQPMVEPAPAPKEPEPVKKVKATKPKKAKVATLAQYLKPYKGAYQSYEDSNGNEVMYPTSVIKRLITLAYNGATFDEIVNDLEYNPDEVQTMLYDHYQNRSDIENDKPWSVDGYFGD
jgi:hypothetical protein